GIIYLKNLLVPFRGVLVEKILKIVLFDKSDFRHLIFLFRCYQAEFSDQFFDYFLLLFEFALRLFDYLFEALWRKRNEIESLAAEILGDDAFREKALGDVIDSWTTNFGKLSQSSRRHAATFKKGHIDLDLLIIEANFS